MDSLLLFQERIAIKTRSALKQERCARRYLSVLMNFEKPHVLETLLWVIRMGM